ncbi:hypothetical protein ACS0TY_001335 [Phlomoides rotata]
MTNRLDDTASPFFSKRAKLVETVAKLRFGLVMLDIGCEDLVIKMFKSFFSVVRENHPQSLISSILSIITSILEEKAEVDIDSVERSTFQSLLDMVLENIIKGREDVASASFQLAVSVVQICGEKVESCIYQLLKSCILNRDAVQSVIKESYNEIILEVYQIAPQLSLSVIPLLTNELLAGTALRDMDVTSSNEQVEIEAGTTSRDIDVPSSNKHVDIEANIMEDRHLSTDELRDKKSKQLALKRKHLVEHHQRSIHVIHKRD